MELCWNIDLHSKDIPRKLELRFTYIPSLCSMQRLLSKNRWPAGKTWHSQEYIDMYFTLGADPCHMRWHKTQRAMTLHDYSTSSLRDPDMSSPILHRVNVHFNLENPNETISQIWFCMPEFSWISCIVIGGPKLKLIKLNGPNDCLPCKGLAQDLNCIVIINVA